MKTLIIDNYDSFTYNLYQYFAELKANPVVYLNNQVTVQEIEKIKPSHIVISPGPGTVEKTEDFGICRDVIAKFGPKTPLLGVCLGHQGIASAFGATIEHAPNIMHGKTSQISHTGKGIFKDVKNPFTAMRYHSLCVSEKNFPSDLIITARVIDDRFAERKVPGALSLPQNLMPREPSFPQTGTIMALQHKKYPIFGIQFHPESFETEEGKTLLANFLKITA